MLQPPVERFRGAVGCAGPVEVGQHVGGPLVECPAEAAEFGQGGGDALVQGVDDGGHGGASASPVGVAVGGDHSLQDAPGGLDLDVIGRASCRERVY